MKEQKGGDVRRERVGFICVGMRAAQAVRRLYK